MLQIRRAVIDDSKDIFEWRNDELTREMSITSDLINRQDHDVWFNGSLNNPNRVLYMGENEQGFIGMCRFDIDGDKAVVSINLNPSQRGKKLSLPLLKQAINKFFVEYKCNLFATIKNNNVASIRCFEKVGFKKENSDGVYSYYVLEYGFLNE